MSYPAGATNGNLSSGDANVTNGISLISAQALAVFYSSKEVLDERLFWAGCGSLERNSVT